MESIEISGHFYITLNPSEAAAFESYADAIAQIAAEGDPLRFSFEEVADDYDCYTLEQRKEIVCV